MKNVLLIIGVALATGVANAQSVNSGSQSGANSDAGAMAQTGAITFEASDPLKHQRVSTTPSMYSPPIAVSSGGYNCGGSDSGAISVTGFGIAGGKAREMLGCATAVSYELLMRRGTDQSRQMADLVMNCYGREEVRMAFEALGGTCPESAGPSPTRATNRTTQSSTGIHNGG